MLLCILTGGNIDLSVGSIVCFAGAVGATFMVNKNMSVGMSIMGVDANWQKVVKGIVLLAAVIFDVESKKRSK